MKKLVLILMVLSFSCASDKKDKTEEKQTTGVEATNPKKENVPIFNFPIVENLLESPQLINISYVEHYFEEDIVFEEINVLKTAENTFTFIFVINHKTTNFDKLKEWRVGMYLFAKDPKKFQNKTETEKGFKRTGMLAEPKMMGDEVVIVLKDFKIVPKEFTILRLYLYNLNNDMNKNYYDTNDVVFP